MHIWISGGGSGGHVYPGLTVSAASGLEPVDFTWLGRPGSLEERLVTTSGMRFAPISAAPFVGRGVAGRLMALASLGRGLWQAWRLAGRERPLALLVTGGYVSVPVALAAWLRRVPVTIYLPDIRPGRAVRFLAPFARRIAVTSAAAEQWLPPGKLVATGYPTRPELRAADRAAARSRWSLAPGDRLLLVFGGSQGSRRINRAAAAAAPRLLEACRIIHVSGPLDLLSATAERAALPEALRERYHVYGYLDSPDMAMAMAAADLVVCRAGAASLGELPALGLAAILVPLPISGGHQLPNARQLESVGAAEILSDDECDGPALAAAVLRLLATPDRLLAMGQAARRLDRPDAAAAIWAVMRESLPAGIEGPQGGAS